MNRAKKFALGMVLAGVVAVAAQPVYTNADITTLKARYLPKLRGHSRSTPAYPSAFDNKPYQTPKYVSWLLPYEEWTEEYRGYFDRHYRDPRVKLDPTLICMHYTVTDSAEAVWNSFRRGCRMSNGNKGTVPGHVSVHLMIDQAGTVYQLLPFDRRCTGAYGVNHKALSIEMVARDEADLLSRPAQVWASFCVVRDLMKRFQIPSQGVIAHYEVSQGKSVVPDYLDYNDSECPDRYPDKYARFDPGTTYMAWLRSYLQKNPP